MATKKYCFCYPYNYGITILGFLQLNAALFFWARFTNLNQYYCWLDLAIAMCYTARTVYFFIDQALDSSLEARKEFNAVFQATTYVICGLGIAICAMKWQEWAYIPTWNIVGWGCQLILNGYHCAAMYGYVEDFGSSNEDDLNSLKKSKSSELTQIMDGFGSSNKLE